MFSKEKKKPKAKRNLVTKIIKLTKTDVDEESLVYSETGQTPAETQQNFIKSASSEKSKTPRLRTSESSKHTKNGPEDNFEMALQDTRRQSSHRDLLMQKPYFEIAGGEIQEREEEYNNSSIQMGNTPNR